MKKKKSKVSQDTLRADGHFEQADAIEANPEFEDEYHDMAAQVFKKTNPGLYALMKRVKGGSDDEPV